MLLIFVVDGIFMAWTEWSSCSQPCGGGERWRDRQCDGPYYGGNNCTGDFEEIEPCNTHSCSGQYYIFT